MPKSEQDLNLSSLEKLKANKLESPFEWKMDSKTPERPFRDRFKLGHNKIAGKITLQTEANDIVEMTSYLNKQNQYIMQCKTFYPMKKLMMDRSKSTSNINPDPIPTYTGQNISKYSSQQSESQKKTELATPKLNLLTIKREEFFKKSLPQIKSERENRADTWRQKRNRNRGDICSNVNYYSTKQLNCMTNGAQLTFKN